MTQTCLCDQENQYEHSYPPLGPRLASPLPTPSGPSSTPPVLPRVAEHPPLPRVVDHPPLPRGLERRSMTVGQRDRSHDKEQVWAHENEPVFLFNGFLNHLSLPLSHPKQRGSPSVRRLSTSDATLSAMDSSQEDDLQVSDTLSSSISLKVTSELSLSLSLYLPPPLSLCLWCYW